MKALYLGLDTFGDVTVGSDGRKLSQSEVIRNVVAQAELADSLGVDYFGVGEHHRADFAISSPEVVLAAIAARTKSIRLGSAATILSTDDPVRVFQRFSTLHALSKGRAEITVGRGWFVESFPLFGYEIDNYGQLFESKLQLLTKLVRQEVVTWRGPFRAPLENHRIFPPLKGLPPLNIRVAVGSTPESLFRAARHDLPIVLAVIGGEPARFAPFLELYRQACEKLGRASREVSVHSSGYVADTDERARREFWPAYKEFRDRIGGERGWAPLSERSFANEIEKGSLFVGSPQTIADKIVGVLRALGASRFELKFSVGCLSQEYLMQSIALFGEKVVPSARILFATNQ